MIYGSNPTLLNVTYIKPDRSKQIQESFEVIYKTEDGSVHLSNEPAEVDIYFTKEKFRNHNYNKPQEQLTRLDKKRVLFSQIRYAIAKEIGDDGLKFIEYCYQNKVSEELNRLYGWRFCYLCDFQPEFYFIKDWYSKYKLNTPELSKAFMDIEIDMMDFHVDLSDLKGNAYAPVNCVTVFFEDSKECFTFVLRPQVPGELSYKDEKLQERKQLFYDQERQHNELMADLKGFKNELRDSFEAMYGVVNYEIKEFDNEMALIYEVFKEINKRKPNYCLIWNMRFDIQYLIERIKILGYDPRTVICHPDFKNPVCYFKQDSSYEIKKQTDYFYCSSYTQYICQMRTYASIRKSQHTLKSVKLNAISDMVLGDKKIDYSEETDIIMFPYKNWRKFIKYNIKDVLLQVGIERKTNDVLTYYMRGNMNYTHYSKMFKETHLLRNVREIYFEKDGWVQGNNLNIISRDPNEKDSEEEPEEETSYKGAINADPIWNDNVGIEINGLKSNTIFKNCIDMDMEAFYPSIKIVNNMDASTLLYKASFDNDEFLSGEFTNRSLNQTYREKDKKGKDRAIDFTGEAVNTFASNNLLTFGYNYLNLPSVEDLYEFLKREL